MAGGSGPLGGCSCQVAPTEGHPPALSAPAPESSRDPRTHTQIARARLWGLWFSDTLDAEWTGPWN